MVEREREGNREADRQRKREGTNLALKVGFVKHDEAVDATTLQYPENVVKVLIS